MTVKINGNELPFPIVSFAPFLNGGKAERTIVAQQLYDAFHVYGWVYLKDFGIPEEEIDAMFGRVSTVDASEISGS
jgi:isopenicillin N synthase-like dioxygenase